MPSIPFYNLILLSVASLLFFASFSTTQATLSTLHKDIGYYSLSLLYLFFALGNLVAPLVERVIGAKVSLIIGALPYCFFVLSAGVQHEIVSKVVLLVFGALLGLSASLFWVSQGDFIVQNAQRDFVLQQRGDKPALTVPRLGLFSGIFFSIFSLNGLIGNLANGLMSSLNFPKWLLYSVLAIVAAVGVTMLLFLVPPTRFRTISPPPGTATYHSSPESSPEQHSLSASPVSSPDFSPSSTSSESLFDLNPSLTETSLSRLSCCSSVTRSFFASLRSLLSTFLDPKMLLFTPISLYSGASLGFFQGNLPPQFGEKWIPWVMAVFSLCSGCSAIVVGRLSDRLGKRIFMGFTFMVHLAALLATFSLPYMQPYSFFWTMALCGMGDDSLNTMAYSFLGAYFESAESFALFKLVQSVGSGLSFFGGSILAGHFLVIQCIMLALWFIASSSFLFMEIMYPVDVHAAKRVEEQNIAEEGSGVKDLSFETYGSDDLPVSPSKFSFRSPSQQHEM